MVNVKSILKKLLRSLVGDYEYWKVFAIDLPQPPASLPAGMSVRELERVSRIEAGANEPLSPVDQDAVGFGLYNGDDVVAKQWYWWGARYEQERKGRSWHLTPNSAKSTNLYTLPKYRGQGYATILKRHTAFLMSERGFSRLYSRIWHNHQGSIRVSEKNGWRIVGYYVEFYAFSNRVEMRIHKA